VLISFIGSTAALWFDAGTFLVSALLVALFVREPEPETPTVEVANPDASYLDEVWEGIRWIRADPRLMQVLVSASIVMTLVAAFMTVIMPVYADAVFADPVDLGIFVAAFGLGSLIGSLGFGYFEKRAAGWNSYILSTAALGVPLAFLAFEPSLPLAAVLAAFIGIAFGPIIPSMDTLIQQRTTDSIRGRIFSTRFALNNAVKLPGLLVIGVLLDAPGLAPTLLGLGVVAIALAALMALWRVEALPVPATPEAVELGEANPGAGD
jgi:predicted MFS family arabinose efflux permease